MPGYTTEQIRNVALVGHSSAGKTTLFEALLHAGGTIQTAGSIERGSTVSDHDPLEKEHKHSLHTAIASIDHGGVHVNLIDTPGYPDFRGPTLTALAAVETVAIVVNGHTGIEFNTTRMMEYAKARGLCRMLIVNKIDGTNCRALIEQLRDAFGTECLPINVPAMDGKTVADCFFKTDGISDLGPVRSGTSASSTRWSRSTRSSWTRTWIRASRACPGSSSTTRSSSACAKGIWCRSASPPGAPAPA
jgi:elongation factor G